MSRRYNLRYLAQFACLHRLVLLGKVDDMRWLVLILAKIVNVEMFTLVNNEEFAHSAHEPAIIGVHTRATSFGIEI